MPTIDKVAKKVFKDSFNTVRKEVKLTWVNKYKSYIIPRMGHFLHCTNLVKDIPGAIAEAGVRGGESLATIALLNEVIAPGRKIMALDSFLGFPPDAMNDGIAMPGTPTISAEMAIENVKTTLKLSGLNQKRIDDVVFIQGYFEDSLKNYDQGPIALLHIDVDLGKSYTEVLEALYPSVQTGGVITFDEYDAPKDLEKWPEAKPAIDDFFNDKKFEVVSPGYIQKYAIRKLD